tara:strand:+ start:109 stop:381 length:273 start_codon:yes stop_codon:yes gene_type:complete
MISRENNNERYQMEVIKGDFGKTTEEKPKKLIELLHEALASADITEDTVGKFVLIAEIDGDDDDFKLMTAYDTMETNYIIDVSKLAFLGY